MTTTEAAPPPASGHSSGAAGGAGATRTAPEPVDENIWLEDIYGEEPLAWVREQNARTEDMLEDANYAELESSILEVLDSTDRIAMVGKHGEWYYNFWKDRDNPKGLWRRTSWESYRGGSPEWDILLDLDALSAAEGQEWVFHGATFLRPANGRAAPAWPCWHSPPTAATPTATASSTSSPAASWTLPPAASTCPRPRATRPGSTQTRCWWPPPPKDCPRRHPPTPAPACKLRRGGSLATAERVFEIPEDHMMALVAHDSTPGFERTFAVDWISFFERTTSVLRDGRWVQLDVPVDVNLSSHRGWLLFRPQKDWTVNGTVYPAGSLLAAGFEDFLAGSREFAVLFTPDARTSLQSWSWTRDFLLLNLLRDVSSEIRVLDPLRPGTDTAWASTVLDACPPLHDVNAYAVDDEDDAADADDDGTDGTGSGSVMEREAPGAGNDFWLVGYRVHHAQHPHPRHPRSGNAETGRKRRGRQWRRRSRLGRDARGDPLLAVVLQRGSLRSPAALRRVQGRHPGTLLPGGRKGPGARRPEPDPALRLRRVRDFADPGLQRRDRPRLAGAAHRGVLRRRRDPHTRGGVYVVANIRGGGEYGPPWHRAALQENRHRAYEDFAAVAMDLISRGVTSRERLGCVGGSNGGLLVGNMLTRYPELFGAVSCGVPLLDMRRYTKLSAGYSWIAEYGDPDVPEQWEFIKTFSPYHLLRDGVEYPETFIWTATSDDRVGPVQARKMAARMQAMGIPNVWFHEALEGGHAGASDNRQAAALQSRSQHFLWRALAGRAWRSLAAAGPGRRASRFALHGRFCVSLVG